MKKILILALAALSFSAMAEQPFGKRTPNGGFEYYSNEFAGRATPESDCVLPPGYSGFTTTGVKGLRHVSLGDVDVFVDCKPLPPVVIAEKVVVTKTVVVEQPAPTPAPVVEAPKPAPAPVVKKIRE